MEEKTPVFSLITSSTSTIHFLNVSLSSFFAKSCSISQLLWKLHTCMIEILLFLLRGLQKWNSQLSRGLAVHMGSSVTFFLYRHAQENKKEGDKEGIYWLEKQKMKCQAMQKSVNSRAKALDPHKSLEETQKEKSKQNRSVSYSAQK